MSNAQAERRLILLSAGTAKRRLDMREQAGLLMGEVDWSRLAGTLRLRRLLPSLGPRLLELADGRATDDFGAAVEQAITAGRRQGASADNGCARRRGDSLCCIEGPAARGGHLWRSRPASLQRHRSTSRDGAAERGSGGCARTRLRCPHRSRTRVRSAPAALRARPRAWRAAARGAPLARPLVRAELCARAVASTYS